MKIRGQRRTQGRRREGKPEPWIVNLDRDLRCVGRDGKTKRTYVERQQAREVAKAQRLTRHDDTIRAYHCEKCGAYHIGHDWRLR